MKKYLLAPLAAICLNWSGAALSADFVAVRIEAENFTSKSDRWTLTTPDYTPDVQPDPDPPHNNSASGQANLELLPDSRVTHEDEVFNGGIDGNFWGAPGGGPRIDYNVNVPEAGRYFVYVKTFSTGTEDNGLHVGVNGNLPGSGQRIQICSKHNWFWTSGQRTNDNHCGVTKTIWLDFPAAGLNTVTFFAREDGFEIDQFLLLKETHDGSLDCFPMFNDKIRCKDVATGANQGDTEIPISQTVDGNTITSPPAPEPEPPVLADVDLDIDLNVIGATHYVNDTIQYDVTVTNTSSQDQANNATATLTLPAGLTFNASADCNSTASTVNCQFGTIDANDTDTLSFTATATAEGSHRVDAQVMSDEQDNNAANNTDSESITAQISIPDYEAGITMSQRSNATAISGTNEYTVTITNNGLQDISNAKLIVMTGSGISANCKPQCAAPPTAQGESTTFTFTTAATQSGLFSVTAELVVANDANTSNNTASLSETVISSGVAVSDNNLIVIEAEDFTTTSIASTENAPHWFVIDGNHSQLPTQLDPDAASASSVSGGAYIEALPDLRIDDNATVISGVTNFSSGGVGANLSYNVFFETAGTYNVYARVRANNNQDASLHVGLDNDWPASSAAVSVCNPNGNWQWTNNVNTGSGCNTSSNATISVDAPGMHILMISQDTDGLELDKLTLSMDSLADLDGNGPVAKSINPSNNTDIAISSTLSETQVDAGDSANLTVSVNNQSSTDAAGVTVTITGLNIDTLQPSAFDSCAKSGADIVCSIAEISANQNITETIAIQTTAAATIQLSTSVSTIQSDANSQNNASATTLTVSDVESKETTSSGGGSLSLWFVLSALLLLSLSYLIRLATISSRQAIAIGSKK